jgi:hypothetical protein
MFAQRGRCLEQVSGESPIVVASNLWANLYFSKANEVSVQSRRFTPITPFVGDADYGVSRTSSRYECRRARLLQTHG